jgi:hypothetical protein
MGPTIMIKLTVFIGLITAATIANNATAANLHFSRKGHRNLIELYPSEGCSSCPAAERWLSRLRNNPLLWKRFVPIALHVDYWNHPWLARSLRGRAFCSTPQRFRTPRLPANRLYPGRDEKWSGMARLDVYEHSPAGENNAGLLDATVRNDAVSVAFTPRRRYPIRSYSTWRCRAST